MDRFVIRKQKDTIAASSASSADVEKVVQKAQSCENNNEPSSLLFEIQIPEPSDVYKCNTISSFDGVISQDIQKDTSSDASQLEQLEKIHLEPAPRRKKYIQKFRKEWKECFKWLDSRNSKAFCVVCDVPLNGGITHFRRHEKNLIHHKNYEKATKTPKILKYVDRQNTDLEKSVKRAELKLVGFLHEHNLPFILMDHLILLLLSIFPNSDVAKGLKCNRTKATNMTRDCFAQEHLHIIAETFKNQPFSLIIDETTDVSTQKSLVVIARYYDHLQQRIRDKFIGLLRVKNCTSQGIFDAICSYLNEIKVPITNLLGFAADNASVMMGNIGGVQALFKNILPNIFVLGCVCHSFHLCSSVAAKKLPRSLEDFIRSIYNYFAHSSKRKESFEEFQVFLRIKPKKLLHPSQTRWLSLQAAVDRVLENWEALKLYFWNECHEEDLNSTRNILKSLEHPIYKMYFMYLSYVLDLINKLNLEFQSEKPKIFTLLPRVSDIYRSILRNYLVKEYLDRTPFDKIECKNPNNFLPLESLYLGAKVEAFMASNNNIDKTEIHNFKLRCLEFYIELATEIKKRFNFNDEVLNFLKIFNPEVAVSGEVGSIAVLAQKYFPQLVLETDIEKLNTEWRSLADLTEVKKMVANSTDTEVFWSHIMVMKNNLNELMFPSITILLQGLLSLPHSSAAAERRFSQVSLLKSKLRNRLEIETLDTILHAKEILNDQCCYSWEPPLSLLKRKINY